MIALTAASAYAAKQQGDENQKAVNSRYTENSRAAISSYVNNLSALQLRSQQEIAAAEQTAIANARQGAAGRGTVKAGTAARGVTGTTVGELLGEFSRLEAENNATLATNTGARITQMRFETQGLQAGAQSQISSAAPSKVGPSNLALGLQVAGGAVGAAGQYYQSVPTAQQPAWFQSFFTPIGGSK